VGRIESAEEEVELEMDVVGVLKLYFFQQFFICRGVAVLE